MPRVELPIVRLLLAWTALERMPLARMPRVAPPTARDLTRVPPVEGMLMVRLPLARALLARTAPARMVLARPARVRVRVLPRVWVGVIVAGVVVVVGVGVVCGRRGWWWGRFVRWPKSWR